MKIIVVGGGVVRTALVVLSLLKTTMLFDRKRPNPFLTILTNDLISWEF